MTNLATILSLIALCMFPACRPSQPGHTNKVSVRTDWSARALISPHVDADHILTVGTNRYHHVRGLTKFYLEIPKLESILFITDDENYTVTYHIVNMETLKDIAIPAPSSVFGHDLGHEPPRDDVVSVTSDQIILSNRRESSKRASKTTIVLDLTNRRVLSDQTSVDQK